MAKHPFVSVPVAVLDHADLDAHELLVYMALLRFRDHKTGRCFPGMQTIADTARVSRNTASRTVKKLEDRGIIHVDRVKAVGSKTNASNQYTVGLLPEDPFKYLGRSAKGTRVPTRRLSEESRERLSEAAHRKGNASEALPTNDEPSSSASEVLRSASEVLPVVPPRFTKKNQIKKNHQEDITRTFGESAFENVSFNVPGDEPSTEKQVALIRDLSIMVNFEGAGGIPNDLHIARWRKLTKIEAHDLIRRYYQAIGRPDDIFYPYDGTPEYAALSEAGKAFAESAGMADSVFEYGFKPEENSA